MHKIAILDMRLLNGDRNDANLLVKRHSSHSYSSSSSSSGTSHSSKHSTGTAATGAATYSSSANSSSSSGAYAIADMRKEAKLAAMNGATVRAMLCCYENSTS